MDNNEEKQPIPYSELPKDTNGEWVRTKGARMVHAGEVVPGQGLNMGGVKNSYFDGYVKETSTEVEVTGKGKIFSTLFIIGMIGFFIGIFGSVLVPSMVVVFIPAAIIAFLLAFLFGFLSFKISLKEQEKQEKKDEL